MPCRHTLYISCWLLPQTIWDKIPHASFSWHHRPCARPLVSGRHHPGSWVNCSTVISLTSYALLPMTMILVSISSLQVAKTASRRQCSSPIPFNLHISQETTQFFMLLNRRTTLNFVQNRTSTSPPQLGGHDHFGFEKYIPSWRKSLSLKNPFNPMATLNIYFGRSVCSLLKAFNHFNLCLRISPLKTPPHREFVHA